MRGIGLAAAKLSRCFQPKLFFLTSVSTVVLNTTVTCSKCFVNPHRQMPALYNPVLSTAVPMIHCK